jgi:hypoxanthine-DNA glycosylase
MRKTGLPPLVDSHTEVLILGSLPRDKSIASGHYYANPANDFWRLVGAAINENLEELPYEERITVLKRHNIGLWDALHSCVRPGSMDTDISEQELNDFKSLKSIAPRLRRVCLNGKGAAIAEPVLLALGYDTRILLSSSSANRKNNAVRKKQWADALS